MMTQSRHLSSPLSALHLPMLVPGWLSSSQVQDPRRKGAFPQQWLQKKQSREGTGLGHILGSWPPKGNQGVSETSGKGRCRWIQLDGDRWVEVLSLTCSCGGEVGGRQMWDWAFFLLNTGSSLARGLGRWQWAVSPEG